jgi:tetratricopeptide (TPR) repeat protein
MIHFDSLQHSLPHTRQTLRQQFRRHLPTNAPTSPVRSQTLLSDESVLGLLLDIQIMFESDAAKCRADYQGLVSGLDVAPSYGELIDLGFFREVLGRVHFPLGTARSLAREFDELHQSVATLLEGRRSVRFQFTTSLSDPTLDKSVGMMRDTPEHFHHLDCLTPTWVAARLWERAVCPDPESRLRFCLDRWALLDYFSFAPSDVWEKKTASDFIAAALAALGTRPGFHDWQELRTRWIAKLSRESHQPTETLQQSISDVPSSLLDRFLWFEGHEFSRVRDDYDTCGDFWRLLNLLVDEVAQDDLAGASHRVALSLFDLSIDRPELLSHVVSAAHRRPTLVADLLLDARFCAIACVVIARWPSTAGGWNRDVTRRDDRTGRCAAFSDGVALLSHHMTQGTVHPEEVAAVLSWMHGHTDASRFAVQDPPAVEEMFEAFRAMLATHPPARLEPIVHALLSRRENTIGTPAFAAALDVVVAGLLVDSIPPEPIVNAYVSSMQDGNSMPDYLLHRIRLDSSRALALVRLARRAQEPVWKAFLEPIQAPTLEGVDQTTLKEVYAAKERTALRLRAHIRVLCRAIAAWDGAVPSELVDALAASIQAGTRANVEEGKVAAFAPRYEEMLFAPREEGPLALDVGSAIRQLDGHQREVVLAAVLETNEPLILAQLIPRLPIDIQPRMQQRIATLAPESAATVYSLPEVQARIAALLSAEALDAAAQFIEFEKDQETLGPVPGRALVRLRADMQLLLLRRDFGAISNCLPPDGLTGSERNEALDAIEFYKALSDFKRPDGDLTRAASTFERLSQRHPNIQAYRANLFAVKIHELLGGNLFKRLKDAEEVLGHRLLADDRHFSERTGVDEDEGPIHDCNRALLLLAIGRPDEAAEVLHGISSSPLDDRVAAYSAVALARMGRLQEARDALMRAQESYGDTEVLLAARAQIGSGEPYLARPTPSTAENPSLHVSSALIHLANMDPDRQAAFFESPPQPFISFVLRHVRAAAASVTGLLPAMNKLGLDSCEDDVTNLVQEVLRPRFEMVRWTVVDQSRGGFTKKGNLGERDLAIKKDSADLAVIESVWCRTPVTRESTRSDLTRHFQKVLGYSTCGLFFHLTYCRIPDLKSVLVELKNAAQTLAPEGFLYSGSEDVAVTDSGPMGFIAYYKSSVKDVAVVFLVLDMLQTDQSKARFAGNHRN